MRFFISADMEGTAGVTDFAECFLGNAEYPHAQNQMSQEVAAACRGALNAGAKEVMVKDSHGSTRNVIAEYLPEEAKLTRHNPGDLFPMMSGLQFGYDAAMMTGYHSGAGTDGNPICHTFSTQTENIILNGELMSEFTYNTYIAGYLKTPVVFISGDQAICSQAKLLVPGITSVATQEGHGGATISIHPKLAVKQIEEATCRACSGDFSGCFVEMPKRFTMTIHYRQHADAFCNSFYPGMVQIDAKRLQFSTDDYLEICRAVHFVLR